MDVERRAYAKVNLCLSVAAAEPEGAERAGWHRVASWVSAIDLHDTVRVRRAASGPSRYAIRWADDAPRAAIVDWGLDQDLAVRAHRAMEAKAARELPVEMDVVKRIPTGGGLGGGSSDAAATLAAVNQAWDLGLSTDALRGVAAGLGSDVAFFVDEGERPRPALVTGFGERVERVGPMVGELVVVVPPFACATPAAYAEFDLVVAERAKAEPSRQPKSAQEDMVRKRIAKGVREGRVWDQLLMNDLYIPAVRVEPRLGALAANIAKATRHDVHLTGSGSCLYLVTDQRRGDALAEKVRAIASESGPLAVVRTRLI